VTKFAPHEALQFIARLLVKESCSAVWQGLEGDDKYRLENFDDYIQGLVAKEAEQKVTACLFRFFPFRFDQFMIFWPAVHSYRVLVYLVIYDSG